MDRQGDSEIALPLITREAWAIISEYTRPNRISTVGALMESKIRTEFFSLQIISDQEE